MHMQVSAVSVFALCVWTACALNVAISWPMVHRSNSISALPPSHLLLCSLLSASCMISLLPPFHPNPLLEYSITRYQVQKGTYWPTALLLEYNN